MSVRPAKTQISLGIHPVWSVSSLCAQWVAKDPSFLHAESEYSDQTGWMPRLIWAFGRRTLILLVLSWLTYVNQIHVINNCATYFYDFHKPEQHCVQIICRKNLLLHKQSIINTRKKHEQINSCRISYYLQQAKSFSMAISRFYLRRVPIHLRSW